MSSGNWGNRKPWGGRGRGGFGGRDRGSRGGVNKNYRGHNFGNNRGFRGGRQNDYGGRGPPQPFQNYGKTPRDMPGKRLSEEEIGVTEYINDHEGFLGVIKSRYSDFQVSEINLKGEIAKLTNTKPPQPPVDKDVEQDEDLLLNKYNVEILPMDEWDRINKLAVSEASTEKVEIDVTGMSKEQRTKIHDAVKKAFGDSIVGSTVSDGDKKLVRFERYRKGGWFPTDINPFIQVSREDIMRVQNTDFNGVSTHNPYGGAKMLSTTCIGAVSTVPYNLQGAVSTVPLFSRRDISTVTSHFTNDNRTPQGHSHSGRGVGPMVYLSSAQALSCTQSERVYETVTAICGSRLAHGSTLSDREVAGPMTFSSSAQVLYRTQLDERISGPPWKDSSAQSRTLPCIKVDRSVAWETNLSAPDVTLTDRIVGQSEASSTAKFQCHTQSIVTEDDSPEVSNALEQIEPQDNVFARLDAGWTIQDPKNKTINRVSESEPTINERKKKKNKKQRRKARELARQAIEINTTTLSTHPDGTLTDGNFAELEALPTDTSECHSQSIIIIDSDDSRAVSDVLEQTEPDAILAQLEANWTIQNPKNKTIKPVSEPAIKEIKKKKNRKQRRKARKQARRAIEMNTIALYTHLPDASGNTAYSTPNTNTMKAAIALEVSTPKGNEENPNISRKRTIEVIPPTDPIKRRKLSAKESKLEIISRKRVLVDNIDNSVEAKRQKTETIGNITYAEAVKLGLIVSITTLNRYFTPQLSEEFQQQLQARLMEDARKSNNSPGPIFRGKPIYSNGALRLWCEDEATLSWLKRTSSAITVSSGVKIIIKIKREVEPLVRCGIVLPGVWDDFTLIVKTLRYQNAWAEVDSWKLHRIEKQKTDTFAVISVPESLVKNILEHERRLGFMLGSVYVKFEGSKGFFSEYPPQNVFQNLHKGVESAHMTNQGVRIQYQTLERTDSVSDEDEEFEDHLEIEQNLRYHLDSGVNTRLSNVKKERVGMPREVRIDNRVKWVWGGEHVHFILHKENCDTMDAAQRLAERLRMNLRPSCLGYAGTKDRRAKSSQWFSARKLDPRRLAGAALHLRDIHIGNFTFSDTHLKLGMLKGNRFRIALRNVTAADDSVDKACQLLKDNGFINYYGLQRFGTRADTPTYEIGKSMLKGEFQEAINGILRPRPGPLQYALEQYREHGASAALAAGVRAHNSIELRLLKALASQPKDLLGALNKLARNTRLLYIHSYQSMVWNRAVSERIKRFGLKPAAGDLVPLTEVDDDIDEDSDEENIDDQDGGDKDGGVNQDGADIQDGGVIQDGGDIQDGDHTSTTESKENKTGMQKEPVKFPVKILSQEDVDSGQFSILDIIMPLPGYFIDYPQNMVDFYEELLKKDGLTLELKNKIKSLSMSGAYRRLVTRPIDMSWSFVRYNSPTEDLILSDMDEIRGVTLKETPDGQYKALLLSMSLPASCYATMALRELLKVDTSGDNQALQNNYHKKPDATETSDAKGDEASSENAGESEGPNNGNEGEKENGAKRKLESEDGDAKRAKGGE